MTSETTNNILDIIHACEFTHMCTMGDVYPETRHMTNAMNHNTAGLILHFMTSYTTPKAAQLIKNPKCCLYYFNEQNRHAVRLFGAIEFVTDDATRQQHWRPEYSRFGYGGPADADFILMRFVPAEYKYYVGDKMKFGRI